MQCYGDSVKTWTLAIFRWSFYLILHFSFSLSCFNNMTGKVWTKKERDGKGKYCKYCIHQFLVWNLHNVNLPINLVGKVSLEDYHLTETLHIKGDKINLISTNNCRILAFKLIVPNWHSLLRYLRHVNSCQCVLVTCATKLPFTTTTIKTFIHRYMSVFG